MTRKTRAALVSVCSNITLIIMKIFAGILSGSVSIISEAIHSAMDLVAALIALVAVRKSDIPPDQRHPYGHDKIENVSGVIEALLILLAAGWIIFEAVGKLITPTPIEGVGLGVLVMLFSALVNSGVSAYLYRVAKEEESVALAADALHLKADVLTSLGVAVGLLGIWIAARLGYNLYLLDPIVAICVALFILKEAIAMLKQAFQPLLDHSMNEEELAITTRVIEECLPGAWRLSRSAQPSGRAPSSHRLPPDLAKRDEHRALPRHLRSDRAGHHATPPPRRRADPC